MLLTLCFHFCNFLRYFQLNFLTFSYLICLVLPAVALILENCFAAFFPGLFALCSLGSLLCAPFPYCF